MDLCVSKRGSIYLIIRIEILHKGFGGGYVVGGLEVHNSSPPLCLVYRHLYLPPILNARNAHIYTHTHTQ